MDEAAAAAAERRGSARDSVDRRFAELYEESGEEARESARDLPTPKDLKVWRRKLDPRLKANQ